MADDPPYIQSLLDQSSNFGLYFCVGDPNKGPVERIGIVEPMLMAFSQVLRRLLNFSYSELKEKWDIPVTDITPQVFRNVLKFAYGYNNIENHSLSDSVDLLRVATRWVMDELTDELIKHINSLLNPSNICMALQSDICLQVKEIEVVIAQIIKKHTAKVLKSSSLYLVCPAALRYMVKLKPLKLSEVEVWRAVIKWGRLKVLEERSPTHPDEVFHYTPFNTGLIVPCCQYLQLCSLNFIDLVEEVTTSHSDAKVNIEQILKYHFIQDIPSSKLFLCTESRHNRHLKHEAFQLKMIHDCSSWMDGLLKTSSMLILKNNTMCVHEFYSIVCMGSTKPIELETTSESNATYECKCTVKITLLANPENSTESVFEEITFQEEVMYNEEFHIPLSSKEGKLQLQPNNSYRFEINFSSSHPLWYSVDTEANNCEKSNDIDIECGLINETVDCRGSHARYLILKTK